MNVDRKQLHIIFLQFTITFYNLLFSLLIRLKFLNYSPNSIDPDLILGLLGDWKAP